MSSHLQSASVSKVQDGLGKMFHAHRLENVGVVQLLCDTLVVPLLVSVTTP